MTKITEPGVYDMPDADYQADPCEEISLRASIAWKMVAPKSTPAHAAYGCARLNPDYQPINKSYFDLGKIAHSLLLGKGADYAIVHEENYKTVAARKMADAIRAAGKTPLLAHQAEQVRAMAKAATSQIKSLIDAGTIDKSPFGSGTSEKVLIWRDNGVLCRAMLDGLSIDNDIVSEYKTDGESAAIDGFQWKARKMGYLFKLAFYRRGLEALKLAYSPTFHIFVQETTPPYLLAMYVVDDELIALENDRVRHSQKLWRQCLATGKWPGYPTSAYYLGLMPHEERKAHPAGDANGAHNGGHVDSDEIARTL